MPSLPKPEFKACDETSLSLKLDLATIGGITADNELRLQYKLPHEKWDVAEFVLVSVTTSDETVTGGAGGPGGNVSMSNVDVDNLDPGTPYAIRLCYVDRATGAVVEAGPEIIFDTAPVDCTPKKKTCVVS